MTDFESYGTPAVEIGTLKLWVHGRQFPDATDAWDINWLRVTARCTEAGASVLVSGAILDTVSFQRCLTGLRQLYEQLKGEAVLESVEPHLRVLVKPSDTIGHLIVRVGITPDPMCQGHWFEDGIDQTYLPALMSQLEAVLRSYPVIQPERRGV